VGGSGGRAGSGGVGGMAGLGGAGGLPIDAGASGSGGASGGAGGTMPDAAAKPDLGQMRDAMPSSGDAATSDAMAASPEVEAACTLQSAIFMNQNATAGGGKVFADQISDPQSFIKEIAKKVCLVLYDKVDEVKKVPAVTLVIESPGSGVAATGGARTGFSAAYIGGYRGDVNYEIHGVVAHEFTHIYQNNKTGTGWLIEGIADYVRYKAGYFKLSNRRKGGNYDGAYQTTGFFIAWLDEQYPGFGRKLNLAMKGVANEQTFQTLTGKPIAQLWMEYQASF
jgi:hypothetical protein